MTDGKLINLNFGIEKSFVTNLKSLREGTPSESFIKSKVPSKVWVLKKDRLFLLYDVSFEIALLGRMILEQLLAQQEEMNHLFRLHTPAERYDFIESKHAQLLQKISLSELSSFIGISRETLSRIRKKRRNIL